MPDVNKLDDKKCPFDPEQYKYNKKVDVEVDNVAPIGSLPWALIQVYVGKSVRRNGWDAQVEYIKLLPGSSDNNVLPQIGIIDKEGTTSWQPTQEDLMSCDWVLLSKITPVECMLSFDLTSGRGTPKNWNEPIAWGYVINTNWNPFGILSIKQNNIVDIVRIWAFLWNSGEFYFDVEVKPNEESRQRVVKLFQDNDLWVTVDGMVYNLGKPSLVGSTGVYGVGDYGVEFHSQHSEAQKLGVLLQQMQQTGQTKAFSLNWK